jgi:MFS family permease
MSGGVECMALAFGPLVSGAITRYSQWRVSFYIIIPVGVAVILSVFFFVHDIQRPEHADLPRRQKLKRLDIPGLMAFLPLAISVILALEWGGSEYMWSNWRIILLWVLVGVLLLVFLGVEYRSGDDSMFPLKLLYQRSVAFSALFTFCNSAALFVTAYYVSCLFCQAWPCECSEQIQAQGGFSSFVTDKQINSYRSISKPSVAPAPTNPA